MNQHTHTQIEEEFSGRVIELKEGGSKVRLQTTSNMRTDETGLIHGGFLFSLADYAAMVAVNHPNVVLANANVKFLKPAIVNDVLTANAEVKNKEGKKYIVEAHIFRGPDLIFDGEFTCIVPNKHVLEGRV